MNIGEKLSYQDNKLAYKLVLSFLLLNVVTTIVILKSMTVDFRIGTFIMFNIFFSLLSFLLAIKLKTYSINWGFFSILMSFIQSVRIFVMPRVPNVSTNRLVMFITFISAALLLAAAIVTIKKSKIRLQFILQEKK